MEKIIGASCVFVCDEGFAILKNGGVRFECNAMGGNNKIVEVGDFEELKAQNPQLSCEFYKDCVLLPALSNAHIHFEFSNNKTTLQYGSFGKWLSSVISCRDGLFDEVERGIQEAIDLQIQSGVGSVGAISSYGYDMALLDRSPLRVSLFHEAIGSNPAIIDAMYSNLLARLEESRGYQSHRFTPALALHSPYSTHKILAQKVVALAKEQDLRVSCHFLESYEELEWLTHQRGWFAEFFARFFQVSNAKPSMGVEEFLEILEGVEPLFVHCLFASEKNLDRIAKNGGTIISAPRSNRLLNGKYLDLQKLWEKGILPSFATDGLSSNYSLSLLDELRCAIFAYPELDLEFLAKELVMGVSAYPARALRNQNGVLEQGRLADFAVFEVEGIAECTQEALQFILHAKIAKALYINGIGVL